MRFDTRAATGIALGLCVGCGQAAGPHFNPPFATLFGVITSSSVPTPSEVRVALVWRKRDPDGNILRVAQELAVRADFPVRFRLDIDTLPPSDAINIGTNADGSMDPTFHYATGSLIIYEDVNGNGTLDLLPTDAVGTIDRVLGIPEHLSVFYVESSLPRPSAGAQKGFNLRHEPSIVDPQPGASTCSPVPVGVREYLPLSSEIRVALDADPELSREMCARTTPTPDGGCVGSSCSSIPVPPGALVTCNGDGTSYMYKFCRPTTLCASSSCDYGCGQRSPSDPVPPDWPCP